MCNAASLYKTKGVGRLYCEQKMMDGDLLLLSYDGDDDYSVDGNDVSRSVTMARVQPIMKTRHRFLRSILRSVWPALEGRVDEGRRFHV